MKHFPILLMLAAVPVISSCNRDAAPEVEAAAEPAAEPAATQEGLARQWTAEAFGVLSGRLMQAINEDGHAAAIHVCAMEADDLLGGVADAAGVSIRRVTDRPRNPANAASGRELEMLEMIRNMAGGSEVPASIEQDRVVWLPIRVAMPVCLACHGDPETDIAAETLAAIGEHYPLDRATGYSDGDLRGMWRVEFPDVSEQ